MPLRHPPKAAPLPRFSENDDEHKKKTAAGKEAIGVRNGKLIYADTEDVYGEKLPEVPLTRPDTSMDAINSTAASNVDRGPADMPVRLPRRAERTLDDIRADYQQKYQTPELRGLADRSTETSTRVGFNGVQTTPQRNMDAVRGPASQRTPIDDGSARNTAQIEASRKTDAAFRTGQVRQSLRDGTASEATRKEFPDLAKEYDERPLTMEDLDALSKLRGTPVTEEEKWGLKPKGGQMTRKWYDKDMEKRNKDAQKAMRGKTPPPVTQQPAPARSAPRFALGRRQR